MQLLIEKKDVLEKENGNSVRLRHQDRKEDLEDFFNVSLKKGSKLISNQRIEAVGKKLSVG